MAEWFATVFEIVQKPLELVTDTVDRLMGKAPEEYFSYQNKVDPTLFGNSHLRGTLSKERQLRPGMVMRVERPGYWHYGVYAGGDDVIHFTSPEGDTSPSNEIMRTHISKFIRGSVVIGVLEFPDVIDGKKCFTEQEAVARAESRIGEARYCLLKNNCQHFAIWCRTGWEWSGQNPLSRARHNPYLAMATLPIRVPDFLALKGIRIGRRILSSQYIPSSIGAE
jgi:hypothetical protein